VPDLAPGVLVLGAMAVAVGVLQFFYKRRCTAGDARLFLQPGSAMLVGINTGNMRTLAFALSAGWAPSRLCHLAHLADALRNGPGSAIKDSPPPSWWFGNPMARCWAG